MPERLLSPHACRAAVLSCMDFRFAGRRTTDAIERTFGLRENDYDLITLPGGAQNLTRFELAPHYGESARDALAVAASLHHTEILIVFSHQNCGALKAKGHTFSPEESEEEAAFHRALLAEATNTVRTAHPHTRIESGYLRVNEKTQTVVIERK